MFGINRYAAIAVSCVLLCCDAASLLRGGPNNAKLEIFPVEIFSNDKYINRDKYLRMLDALEKHTLGTPGLLSGTDFGNMVAWFPTKVRGSKCFLLPVQETDSILNLHPGVNQTLREYVESGHVMIVTLSDPLEMDQPVEMLNQVFNLSLVGAAVTPGSKVTREETEGFAWPFTKATATLPYADKVFAVSRSSLPKDSYKVYAEGENVAVFIIPYGNGLVIGYGFDFTDANSANVAEWRNILRISVDMGRFLDKIRLGNSVVQHQGPTFGKIEPYGNWSSTGKEKLPANGLGCLGWRKTLNCDPSGPRDFKGDRTCDDIVPQGESGFCECDNYVQTAVAPCEHRLINCKQECSKVQQRYRKLYGEAYAAPDGHMMKQLVEHSYKTHHENMMNKADVAISSVDAMVKSMKMAQDDVNARIGSYKDPPIWKQLDEAGRQAEGAGKQIKGMATMANPFLPNSIWSYPTAAPDPPPPGYSRFMNVNPTYQKYVTDNIYDIKNTPAPEDLMMVTAAPGPDGVTAAPEFKYPLQTVSGKVVR